jgi:hypothetical protein
MNVAEVRRMTKLPHRDGLLKLPPQRVTVRCACGWYMRNVLASESTKTYLGHRRGAH